MNSKPNAAASITLIDALISSLRMAEAYNQNVEFRPAVILWTDKEREWEALVPSLRERLPQFLTYGPYEPTLRQGTAIWLKCALAGTQPTISLSPTEVPILYLPGVSRSDLRAIEETAKELQPLAELQFRGSYWSQVNGKDWTVRAYLTSANGGLQLDMAGDQKTLDACLSALPELADTVVDKLRGHRLEASDFHSLLTQDPVRDLLVWMDSPSATEAQWGEARFQAFLQLCRGQFRFDPKKDGPLVAAERLADRQEAWSGVWDRFCESPKRYGKIPELIRQATTGKTVDLFYDKSSWPQYNEEAEGQLRAGLLGMMDLGRKEAVEHIQALEKDHAPRRAWVWASLGQAPLATALEPLVRLAAGQAKALIGNSPQELAIVYSSDAWRTDAAAMQALGSSLSGDDEKAVLAAVRSLYQAWLNESADTLQGMIAKHGYPGDKSIPQQTAGLKAGECALFADGLRMDLGHSLQEALLAEGLKVDLSWTWVAYPSVTATSKPAVSPISDLLAGTQDGKDFEPCVADGQKALSSDRFAKEVEGRGFQVLKGDAPGTVDKPGWTEFGDIDHYGHQHGWRMARHAHEQVQTLKQRILALLGSGWTRVKVVTDHGWLLLPGGLPKRELPSSLAETRWSRCGMLKTGSVTDLPRVPWFWNPGLEVASAPGAGAFKAGTEYAHGGLSLQECVAPILVVSSVSAAPGSAKILSAEWSSFRCRVKVTGWIPGLRLDLREKVSDSASSMAEKVVDVKEDGTAGLLARDDAEGKAAFVVLLGPDGQPCGKVQTVVGGDQ